jgi:hypothetical protein
MRLKQEGVELICCGIGRFMRLEKAKPRERYNQSRGSHNGCRHHPSELGSVPNF